MKFCKSSTFTVVILVVFSFTAYGQGLNTSLPNFLSYYYDLKLLNPAFAGMKDKHIITTVYAGNPSGTRTTQLSYASYETSIQSIKSGIGVLTSHDEIGPMTTRHGGFFFNKKLEFNDGSGSLRVGTQLFYRRSEIDYSVYNFVDPIDIPPNEVTNTFNFDLGVLFYSPTVSVGFSMNNALKENESKTWQVTNYNFIVTREFKIARNFKMTPSIVYFTDFEDGRLDINSTFEIVQWILLGAGYSIEEGEDDISFNAGVNIKDWVQVNAHFYSSAYYRLRDYTEPRIEVMVRVNIPHRAGKE